MKFFNPYIALWKNYVNFSARTTRNGYWMAILVNFIIGAIFGGIIQAVPALEIVYTIYGLAILIPSLAISVRRMNDIGRTWKSLFIVLIPIAGPIWFLVLLCKESTAPNGVPVV